MKHLIVVACRALLVISFPALALWLIAERLWREARSTLFLIRCDLLEGLHYTRKAWRKLPEAIGVPAMTKNPSPWTPARRRAVTRKIQKECDRAAARLGARGVVMIALFEDGEYTHFLDAGLCQTPLAEIYRLMLDVHGKVGAGMEGFVQ